MVPDKSKKLLALGIDIGSSKIVVATCEDEKADILLNKNGDRATPFCTAFNQKEQLFALAAEYQATTNPKNTIFGRDVTRIIGRSASNINAVKSLVEIQQLRNNSDLVFFVNYKNSATYISPEQALSMVLNKVIEHLKSHFSEEYIPAVVTVPSMFNSAQRFAIKNACTAAGIDVLTLLNHSTASAITYSLERSDGYDKNILIFDMGSNTLDVGIFEIRGNQILTKYIGGDANLGGDDFVEVLIEHFLDDFYNTRAVNLFDDKSAMARIRSGCEKIKKMLSTSKDAVHLIEAFYNQEVYQLSLTRTDFETMCNVLFERIQTIVQDTTHKSGLSSNQIDEFIIVGGGGRIPKIEEILKSIFNQRSLSKILNQDESLAFGAAYLASKIMNSNCYKVRKIEIQNVACMPLTVQVIPSEIFNLAESKSILPFQSTVNSLPTNISHLAIFQDQMVLCENHMKSNIREISLSISIDGLVKMFFKSDSEARKGIVINHQQLDDNKIKELKEQASMFKSDEKELKQILELRNTIEDNCYKYKRIVESPAMKEIIDINSKNNLIENCNNMIVWLEDHPSVDIQILKAQFKTLENKCVLLIENAKEKAKINKLLEETDLQIENGKYDKAVVGINELIEYYRKKNEQNNVKTLAALYIKRLGALFELKYYGKAINDCNVIIQMKSDDLNIYKIRGQCYFYLNQLYECMDDFKIILSHTNDAKIQSMYEEAEQILLENEFERHIKLAYELYERQEYPKALEANDRILNEPLLKTTRYKTKLQQAHLQRGKILYFLKQYPEAVKWVSSASENNDIKLESIEWRCLCYFETEQFQKAIDDYNMFTKNGRTPFPRTKQNIKYANTLLESKRAKDNFIQCEDLFKTKYYDEVIQIQISYPPLDKKSWLQYLYYQIYANYYLSNRLMNYDRVKQYNKILQLCGKALNINDHNIFVYFIESAVYVQKKEYKTALDKCEAALRIDHEIELIKFQKMIKQLIYESTWLGSCLKMFSWKPPVSELIGSQIEGMKDMLFVKYCTNDNSFAINVEYDNRHSFQEHEESALRSRYNR